MRCVAICVLAIATICGTNTLARAETPITELYFRSSFISWVGKGQTKDIKPSDGYNFYAETTDEYITGGNKSGLLFRVVSTPDTDLDYWDLDFLGPGFTRPVVGFYPNARRFLVDTSVPGLQFDGNHAGDNTLTGQFRVLEATFNSSGVPISYAVDFTQYDEGNVNAWIQGSFRFNSTVPITPVPEPSTFALAALGVATLYIARRIGARQKAPHWGGAGRSNCWRTGPSESD